MKPRFWICIVLLVLLASCAHGGGKPALTFKAAVPEGWKEIPTDDTMMFMTRDGGYKQFVLIRERPLSEPFQFTQKTLQPGMLPESAAEIIVNEILSDSNIRKLQRDGKHTRANRRQQRLQAGFCLHGCRRLCL